MLAKIKTYILSMLLGGLALVYLLWSAFSSGKKVQKSEQQKETIDNAYKAKKSSENTESMSDGERIERMRQRSRK